MTADRLMVFPKMNAPASAPQVAVSSEPAAELVQWVRALQRGTASEDAFERLFKRLYPWVCGLFRQRGFTLSEAEDLAQETLVRAYYQIGSLHQPELFRAWLRSIAGNVLCNELRRRRRLMRAAPEVSIEGSVDDGRMPPTVVDTGPPPDEILLQKERRARLRDALADLPPQMRQCLTLRLEQDLKYREIAAVLKISIGTVKAHLAKGRQHLAARLGDDLQEWL